MAGILLKSCFTVGILKLFCQELLKYYDDWNYLNIMMIGFITSF